MKSIAAQTRPPDELIVCDDRSGDGTVRVIKDFAARAPFPVRLQVNDGSLGPVKNFEKAMMLCEGDYVALSDQDDVWLPEKLKITLGALLEAGREHGEGTPLLAHTDLRVVDAGRHLVAPSFYKHQGLKPEHRSPLNELLIENYVTGCTTVVNRPLLEAGLPIPAPAMMHDWWLALVAATLGRVISLPEVTILYRQHGRNAVGARRFDPKRYVFEWGEFVRRVRARFRQSEALEDLLRERGAPETVAFLEHYNERIRTGGPAAVYWMARHKIGAQGACRTLALYLLLLKRGRFDKDSDGKGPG